MTVVFITGCSSGIGRALAQTFHRNGCQVIATARQLDTLQELEMMGMSVYSLDVTNASQARQVVEAAIATHHHIDILINNAGYGLMGPVIELPIQEIEHQFATNVFAPVTMTQTVAPYMKNKGKGIIVNIGSVSGVVPTPLAGAYCASKSAIHALTETLRMELAPFGIQVVLVQPGAIQSNFGVTATAKVQQRLREDMESGDRHAQPLTTRTEAILKRANASQINATPVTEFTQVLVKKLLKPSPPTIIRLGKKSRWLPFVKQILPAQVLDRILQKQFGI